VGRLVVVLVLASVLALVVLDVLVGRLAFTTRQDHLADMYNDPTVDLPDRGAPVMVLQVADAEVNLVVAEGSDGDILRGGPGLMSGSSMPGEGGNTVVMGRASRFDGYFGFVQTLPEGTEILLRLREGVVARYEVVGTRTLDGDEIEQIDVSAEDRLTLVTSAGGPLDSRRVVVDAELTGLSDPVGEDDAERDAGEVPPSFDVRPPAASIMFLAGVLAIAIGVAAIPELRRRHPASTTVVVAAPAIALGVVLVLFHLDAVLPVTF
jgi:sortase A